MSLKRNIVANYTSQIYGSLIAIVMVPLYVRYMGIEAYGLIGFFTMLQMWFQLLDLGLTPTMARETARFRGGAMGALDLRRLLRTLEGVFMLTGLVGAAAMIAGADVIAGSWLNAEQLSRNDVREAIMIMALIIALRWMCGLYRGVVSGYERLVWMSGFNIGFATARSVLVIPFLILAGPIPQTFFGFQLAVAALELAVLIAYVYRNLPSTGGVSMGRWQFEPLRRHLRLSLSIAFGNVVWVAVTQTDKLVLSKLLPLSEYAHFMLAVLVASGITIVAMPVSMALQPRLTKLSAEGNDDSLIQLYRDMTQLVGVITIPVALMLAFFSEQVLWAWTGNADIARNAAPVLTLYALGNAIMAIGAFPFYLQVAKGDLKLHLIGNALFVSVLIPALVWAAWRYGMVGAGYAWLGANLAYFITWIPRIHNRLVSGLHRKWVARDISVIAILTVAGAATVQWYLTWPAERLWIAMTIGVVAIGLLAIAAASSSCVRTVVRNKW